jgi:rhomboid family GlyGly-CTERM serine protease
MGLNQADMNHRNIRGLRAWWLPGLAVLIAVLLALTGDWGRELFRYDRLAISSGELWRLISGHFVHLGWSHFALNTVGLVLISFLVAARFSAIQWLLITLLIIVGIDLGFWILEPQLGWYVGLSGVLHGLLAAGVASGMRDGHSDSWIIGGLLVIKIIYEQLVGPVPGSEGTSGGDVVVAAHLYGAIAGALAGAGLSFRKSPQASL